MNLISESFFLMCYINIHVEISPSCFEKQYLTHSKFENAQFLSISIISTLSTMIITVPIFLLWPFHLQGWSRVGLQFGEIKIDDQLKVRTALQTPFCSVGLMFLSSNITPSSLSLDDIAQCPDLQHLCISHLLWETGENRSIIIVLNVTGHTRLHFPAYASAISDPVSQSEGTAARPN